MAGLLCSLPFRCFFFLNDVNTKSKELAVLQKRLSMSRVTCGICMHLHEVYDYMVNGNICLREWRYLSNTSKTLTEKRNNAEFFTPSETKVV